MGSLESSEDGPASGSSKSTALPTTTLAGNPPPSATPRSSPSATPRASPSATSRASPSSTPRASPSATAKAPSVTPPSPRTSTPPPPVVLDPLQAPPPPSSLVWASLPPSAAPSRVIELQRHSSTPIPWPSPYAPPPPPFSLSTRTSPALPSPLSVAISSPQAPAPPPRNSGRPPLRAASTDLESRGRVSYRVRARAGAMNQTVRETDIESLEHETTGLLGHPGGMQQVNEIAGARLNRSRQMDNQIAETQLNGNRSGREHDNGNAGGRNSQRNRRIRLTIVLGMLFLFHLAMLGVKWFCVTHMKNQKTAAAWSVSFIWFVLFVAFMVIKILLVDRSYGLIRTASTEVTHTILHGAAFALSYGFDSTEIGDNPMYSSLVSHAVGYGMEILGSVIIQRFYKDASPDAPDFV